MRNSRVTLAIRVFGLALAMATGAAAQQPAPAPPSFAASNLSPGGVRALADNCAGCHGTSGRAAEGSAVTGLAGMPREWLAQSMMQFKEGKKPATVMHQIAKGYSDAEIAAMADYFSGLPR